MLLRENYTAEHILRLMPVYRIMNMDDHEASSDLWIKCGNGLNDKDDSREGIDK